MRLTDRQRLMLLAKGCGLLVRDTATGGRRRVWTVARHDGATIAEHERVDEVLDAVLRWCADNPAIRWRPEAGHCTCEDCTGGAVWHG